MTHPDSVLFLSRVKECCDWCDNMEERFLIGQWSSPLANKVAEVKGKSESND